MYTALIKIDGEILIKYNPNIHPKKYMVEGKPCRDALKYELQWNKEAKNIRFRNEDDKNKTLDFIIKYHLINTRNKTIDEFLNEGCEIDCIGIQSLCVQTGLPCGYPCNGQDVCEKSIFAYFREPFIKELSIEEKISIVSNSDEVLAAVKILVALFKDAELKNHITLDYELYGETYQLSIKKIK